MKTENYYIDYRYIPGSLKDDSSCDNGAVMRVARRTRKAAQKFIDEMKADPHIQWVRELDGSVAKPTSSYGTKQPRE